MTQVAYFVLELATSVLSKLIINHRVTPFTYTPLKSYTPCQISRGHTPAHQVLRCHIDLSLGRLPDPSWRWCLGRPVSRWLDQLCRDNSTPSDDLRRWAVTRGHSGWHYGPRRLLFNDNDTFDVRPMFSLTPSTRAILCRIVNSRYVQRSPIIIMKLKSYTQSRPTDKSDIWQCGSRRWTAHDRTMQTRQRCVNSTMEFINSFEYLTDRRYFMTEATDAAWATTMETVDDSDDSFPPCRKI